MSGRHATAGSSLRAFAAAFRLVLADRAVRAWYLKALARTLIVAITVVVVLLVAGSWGVWAAMSAALGSVWGGLASLVYAVAILYVSGPITAAISGSLVQLLAGERALLSALDPHSARVARGGDPLPSLWRHRRREYVGVAISLTVSLTAWPLILIPFFLPLGVPLFAWALGQENFKAADRILVEHGEKSSFTVGRKAIGGARVGLGLIPALLALVPLVGWLTLPLLQIAAVLSVREVTGSQAIKP